MGAEASGPHVACAKLAGSALFHGNPENMRYTASK